MIYFDNSATTLHKPQAVSEAILRAMGTLGNSGRSFHTPALEAARTVWQARCAVAALVQAGRPGCVAFTSGATESLNLVVQSLVQPGDAVITSVLEHNAVLRPLRHAGATLSYIPCDDEGHLLLENLPRLLQANTRFVFCTHGDNLLGGVTDVDTLAAFCRAHGLLLVLDCAQTLGNVPVAAQMADVLCFTGHKALLGPQGMGGIVARDELPFALTKTGGTGYDTFAPHQPLEMPDVFEAGTPNAHGLAGLCEGVAYVNEVGIEAIHAQELALTRHFLQGVRAMDGVQVYGAVEEGERLPIVALNVGDFTSEDVALLLWEKWAIATRPGAHCAPLLHQRFGTRQRGMVRFSFSTFNTHAEIDTALCALAAISEGRV